MSSKEFEQQLAELRPVLFRFTKRFVQDREDSLDLVQDTIVKALRYRLHFRENNNLPGWLYVIMRNTFINQYRKRSLMSGRALNDDLMASVQDDSLRNSDTPLYVEDLWRAINSLSKELSDAFTMHLSGYRYEEIAKEFAVPLGTVKSRIFMARQQIKNQLTGYC